LLKQTKDFLGLLKSEVEEESEFTKNVKSKLQKFLLDGGLFSDFRGLFSRTILLSSETQEKLENAKEILHNSTEEEAREKLGLNKVKATSEIKPTKTGSTELEKGGVEENQIKENKEYLKNFSVSEQYIIEQAKKYGITNQKQIAYILATVKGESGFKNIKEIGGENKKYGKDGYYGRGFVQLTHKYNYEKFTKIIKNKNLQFKDNSGKYMAERELNLVQHPDSILKSNDLAAFILVYGMKEGLFTGKKLSDFINEDKADFYNARSIVNGMSSIPHKYKQYAEEYLSRIEREKSNEKLKYKETLLLGDSHVGGMKGLYQGKSEYFNGYDTGQLYNELLNGNINLSGKKNVILYTGSNDITKNKIGELNNNLTKIKNFLDKKNISLVLCKIPYNKSKTKNKTDEVNTIFEQFSEQHKIVLLDLNSKIKILDSDYSSDLVHFNTSGYRKINSEIDRYMVA
ncbi:MAG TPA: hypothetical protein PLP73_02000, partial [Candidatus Absconditabacterales bacterium]|nr:hypothetical protein [Candidatus Absconditabacterales bacterium]